MILHSIQWYLEQWGAWQRVGKLPIPRYVSPAYAIMCQNVEQSANGTPVVIDDDTALSVDKAICSLALRDMKRARTIWWAYCCRWSDERICDELRVSRNTAIKERQCAESWLDGVLFAVPAC